MQQLCPRGKPTRTQVPLRDLPWFWIGGEINNNTVGITELVNSTVRYSTVVTPEFLSEVSGYTQPVTWKYIDALTLEEKEFPRSGIVIE
jgi:hypothetical protein